MRCSGACALPLLIEKTEAIDPPQLGENDEGRTKDGRQHEQLHEAPHEQGNAAEA